MNFCKNSERIGFIDFLWRWSISIFVFRGLPIFLRRIFDCLERLIHIKVLSVYLVSLLYKHSLPVFKRFFHLLDQILQLMVLLNCKIKLALKFLNLIFCLDCLWITLHNKRLSSCFDYKIEVIDIRFLWFGVFRIEFKWTYMISYLLLIIFKQLNPLT